METEHTGDRVGDWIQTFTGKQFWPLDPRPGDIHIEDIAHALSNICRFTGHCRTFYSVAEHSVRVAATLPQRCELWGLLHDASEAYLCDLPRPVKRSGALGVLYCEAERKLSMAVAEKFALDWPEPPEVKLADDILLVTEQRDLMGRPPEAVEGSRSASRGADRSDISPARRNGVSRFLLFRHAPARLGMKPKSEHGGRGRLLAFFRKRPGEWIPLPQILRLGVAQYNARISQLRAEGYRIENRVKWEEGVKNSWFRFDPEKTSGKPATATNPAKDS